jgi:DNA-directed RNA polymerase specialized sigma24 family protein
MSALPLEQSYEAVCPLIMKQCHRIRRKRQQRQLPAIEWEDLTQEAFIGFMDAHRTYKEGKSKFSTWVYRKVQTTLAMMEKKTPIHRQSEHLHAIPAREPACDWRENLSGDGLNVVELTLKGLPFLTNSKRSPEQRQAIKQHLRELGWDWQRIHNTFNEIRRNMP